MTSALDIDDKIAHRGLHMNNAEKLGRYVKDVNILHEKFISFIRHISTINSKSEGRIPLTILNFEDSDSNHSNKYKFTFLRDEYRMKFKPVYYKGDLFGKINFYYNHDKHSASLLSIYFDRLGNSGHSIDNLRHVVSEQNDAYELIVTALLKRLDA